MLKTITYILTQKDLKLTKNPNPNWDNQLKPLLGVHIVLIFMAQKIVIL
jgi:hypothetical protein